MLRSPTAIQHGRHIELRRTPGWSMPKMAGRNKRNKPKRLTLSDGQKRQTTADGKKRRADGPSSPIMHYRTGKRENTATPSKVPAGSLLPRPARLPAWIDQADRLREVQSVSVGGWGKRRDKNWEQKRPVRTAETEQAVCVCVCVRGDCEDGGERPEGTPMLLKAGGIRNRKGRGRKGREKKTTRKSSRRQSGSPASAKDGSLGGRGTGRL